jgi:hypothetical protein
LLLKCRAWKKNENLALGVTPFVTTKGTTVLIGEIDEQTSADWAGLYATDGGFQIYIPNQATLMSASLLGP